MVQSAAHMGCLTATLLLLLTSADGALPPVGYVNPARLAEAHPRLREATQLEARAAALRTQAAEAAPVPVPPAPDARGPRLEGPFVLGGGNGEEAAAELELALLREALEAQLERERLHETGQRARALYDDFADFRTALDDRQRAWERTLILAQRFDRINWQFRRQEPTTGPDEQLRLTREMTALDTITSAVGRVREAEHRVAETRYRRQQAALLTAELDQLAAAASRAFDRQVARREAELAAERDQRRQARTQELASGEVPGVELALAGWRAALPLRAKAVARRADEQRQALLEEATALETAALERRRTAPTEVAGWVAAWIKVIARRAGVELVTEPTAGVPDVTDTVRQRIDALQAAPADLAPRQELPWP